MQVECLVRHQVVLVVLAESGPVRLFLKPELEQLVRGWDVRDTLLVLQDLLKARPLFKHFLAFESLFWGALTGAHCASLGVLPVIGSHALRILRDQAIDLVPLLFQLAERARTLE